MAAMPWLRSPEGPPRSRWSTTRSRGRRPTLTQEKPVATAIAGSDCVLSTLGVPFTRKPISIYSEGIAGIVAGMERHGVKRVVVVSSVATAPRPHAEGGFLLNRVVQPCDRHYRQDDVRRHAPD